MTLGLWAISTSRRSSSNRAHFRAEETCGTGSSVCAPPGTRTLLVLGTAFEGVANLDGARPLVYLFGLSLAAFFRRFLRSRASYGLDGRLMPISLEHREPRSFGYRSEVNLLRRQHRVVSCSVVGHRPRFWRAVVDSSCGPGGARKRSSNGKGASGGSGVLSGGRVVFLSFSAALGFLLAG